MENFFKNELIELDLKSTERDGAIKELTSLLDKEGYVLSKEDFLQEVFDREKLSDTAMGFGVAIPHGKSLSVKKSAIVFGRSKTGIEWGTSENELVDSVFLIAVPEDKASDEHLKILAMLSRSLMDENFRKNLKESPSSEEVLKLFMNHTN